ncbi:MAG: hypothetical protein AAF791_04345 [Bacteroidota bacterium]
MSKSDWALLALNILALMMAGVGLATQHAEPMTIALLLGSTGLLLSSSKIVRAGSDRKGPARTPARKDDRDLDEMDARSLLDIDARLEALERYQRDTEEADRIRQMAARGEQSAPSAPEAAHLGTEADRIRA